uniref:C-type lectin 2 n=1 Tax=Penaeus japonicus TaxID=27405 RepID=V5N901_PENJP|nr:C-type lectin 2 [Penaeus japonicus]
MASTTQLLLSLATLLVLARGCAASCSSNQIRCKRDDKCISISYVCNGRSDCPDSSDENTELCKLWTFNRSPCSSSSVYCSGCRSYDSFCSSDQCARTVDAKVCRMVQQRMLHIEEDKGMTLSDDAVALMTSVVNSTLSQKYPECPMLYTRVGGKCLAFFSLAKVPWPEARQFCKSIYGDLVTFKNLQDFGHVIEYLKETLITSDFWIGGRYDMDVNAWAWAIDDTPMPLGSPYWAERYSSSCVPRSPPHTDPFSNPPSALPEAPCYNYIQAPKQRNQGWCSAITYEHFYFISDDECQNSRSPLCLLHHEPEGV